MSSEVDGDGRTDGWIYPDSYVCLFVGSMAFLFTVLKELILEFLMFVVVDEQYLGIHYYLLG